MEYYKNIATGTVVAQETAPTGYWWRVATAREYREYRERIARALENLERAVAYKARVLGVSDR